MLISQNTIEKVFAISQHDLFAHDVIRPARVKVRGYHTAVCPICGSGSGEHGSGMVYYDDSNTHHCYGACGKTYSVTKLLAIHYGGLDVENDFAEIIKRACAEFGISLEYDTDSNTKSPNYQSIEKIKDKPAGLSKADLRELPLIRDDIERGRIYIGTFIDSLPNKLWRGLTLETLKRYGCGYLESWQSPKSRLAEKSQTLTPRLIIPTQNHYLARLTVPLDSFDEKARKYIIEKPHAGHKEFFGEHLLTENADLILVFEGEIDAMSAYQATDGKYICVATSGAGEIKWLKRLEAIYKEHKPNILLIFDDDNTGRTNAEKRRIDLLKRGFKSAVQFLPLDAIHFDDNETDKKVDANRILVTCGDEKLAELIDKLVADAQGDFEKADSEIADLLKLQLENKKKDLPPHLQLSDDERAALFCGDSSDADNSARIEYLHGSKIRYDRDSKTFMNFENGLWHDADPADLYGFALDTAAKMMANADGDTERKMARSLKQAKKIAAAIGLLKGSPRLRIRQTDLDRHKNLVLCKNGVVNLENGDFHTNIDPALLITQQLNADYRENFHSDVVDKFFESIQPNEETRAGLLSYLGYALTGENSAQKFMFWAGVGANGKSTLSNFLLNLFADYGVTVPVEIVLKGGRSTNADNATPVLNSLKKKRLAVSEEIPVSSRLDITKIKSLTGGDNLYSRQFFKEAGVIKDPTHKLVISGNNLPSLDDAKDVGLIRRLLNVPFVADFRGDRADATLPQKLKTADALSGLLTLLVENAKLWYRDQKLIVSAEMTAATERYLRENDFLADFISENCVYDSNAPGIPRNEFIKRLKEDCDEAKHKSRAVLTSMIEKLDGVEYRKGGRNHTFHLFGVRWATGDDNETDSDENKNDAFDSPIGEPTPSNDADNFQNPVADVEPPPSLANLRVDFDEDGTPHYFDANGTRFDSAEHLNAFYDKQHG